MNSIPFFLDTIINGADTFSFVNVVHCAFPVSVFRNFGKGVEFAGSGFSNFGGKVGIRIRIIDTGVETGALTNEAATYDGVVVMLMKFEERIPSLKDGVRSGPQGAHSGYEQNE